MHKFLKMYCELRSHNLVLTMTEIVFSIWIVTERTLNGVQSDHTCKFKTLRAQSGIVLYRIVLAGPGGKRFQWTNLADVPTKTKLSSKK